MTQPTAPVPPVPARLAHLPTVGGLVVPWITATGPDGRPTFGQIDAGRQTFCLHRHRCQICGRPLTVPLVLLLRGSDLKHQATPEPALHPECAAYALRGCPMLNGALSHYRSTPRPVPPGYTSTDATTSPGPTDATSPAGPTGPADLGDTGSSTDLDRMAEALAAIGIPLTVDMHRPARLGAPAEPWYAVWLDTYRVEPEPRTGGLRASYAGITPRRIRPVPNMFGARRGTAPALELDGAPADDDR